MTDTDDFERRLVALESRIAFQDRTIEELNEVIIDQARTLERLVQQLTAVERQLRAAPGAGHEQADAERDKPPHY